MRRFLFPLFRLIRRPKIGFGLMLNGFRGRKNQVRNPQFIGFLQESGFRRGHPDRYEISLRRRRAILNLVILLLLTGFVWVMIESAHALSLFGN